MRGNWTDDRPEPTPNIIKEYNEKALKIIDVHTKMESRNDRD
jgi:hypothetical protein